MASKPKIAVAMSGGVDSTVACYLLMKKGFDVFGLTMKLLDSPSVTALQDGEKVCRQLGIPHHTVDFVKEFESEVIDAFVHSYVQGMTPNPCLLCNRKFKFGRLLNEALKLGAKYLATGHYARVGKSSHGLEVFVDNHVSAGEKLNQVSSRQAEVHLGPGLEEYLAKVLGREQAEKLSGRYLLARGRDPAKDQSYALYGLTQFMLKHAMFPLGNLSKQEVRGIAAKEKLVSQDKPESQEICFAATGRYADFLRERKVKRSPGLIVDTGGNTLGEHKGIQFYTVGQRKGLGISSSRPLYVVRLDPQTNQVVVGGREEVYSKDCYVRGWNFIMSDPPEFPVRGTCMVRYRGKEVGALLAGNLNGGRSSGNTGGNGTKNAYWVNLDESVFAVTPGQALVFYQGPFVYGGGTIVKQKS